MIALDNQTSAALCTIGRATMAQLHAAIQDLDRELVTARLIREAREEADRVNAGVGVVT